MKLKDFKKSIIWIRLLLSSLIFFYSLLVLFNLPGVNNMLHNLAARESGGFLLVVSAVLFFIPRFQATFTTYLIAQVFTILAIILLFSPVYRIHGLYSSFNYYEWVITKSPDLSIRKIQVIPEENLDALFYLKANGSKYHEPPFFFILLHGGGFTSGKADYMNNIGGFLASIGIPAFSLNYSLAPQKTFPKQIQEIDSLLMIIRSSPEFDDFKNKAFILLGGSAGATIALNYAYLKPDTALKMVINLYGLTDPGFIYPESAKSNAMLKEMVNAYKGSSNVDDISPLQNAININVPVYTFHGSDDVIVPVSHAEVFYQKRKESGFTKDRLFIMSGATHLFDHPISGPSGQFLKEKIKQVY